MKDSTVLKGVFMKGEYCALLGSWVKPGKVDFASRNLVP